MDNHPACLALAKGKTFGVPMPAETRHKPFPILNLPREMRDIVWGFLVVIPKICVTGLSVQRHCSWPQPADTFEYRFCMVATSENITPAASSPQKKERPDLSIFLGRCAFTI